MAVTPTRRTAGFTLLEMTLVLTIIAIVVGVGISATLGLLESSKRIATEKKLDVIEDALMAYRLAYNRLPCPADRTLAVGQSNFLGPYGTEGLSGSSCIFGAWYPEGGEGSVPTRTLNLPDSYSFDGWGRKITYAVSTTAVATDGFDRLDPKSHATCTYSIKITGPGGVPRGNAVYALISHGPNGHGAYGNNALRTNTGSTNADELANCNCTSAGVPDASYTPAYVQHDAVEDPTTPSDSFDDIVRFKPRWRMLSGDDQFNFSEFPLLAYVVHDHLALARPQCGDMPSNFWAEMPPVEIGSEDTASSSPGMVIFTEDGEYLLNYSTAGCRLYSTNRDAASGALTFVGAVPSCPAFNNTDQIALSDTGILAISHSASPYVRFWQFQGDQFVLRNDFEVRPTPGTLLPSQPTRMGISGNGQYLFVSAAGYSTLYTRRHDNVYRPQPTQPTNMPLNASAAAFPSGGNSIYLAVSSGAIGLRSWHLYSLDERATQLPDQTPPLSGNVYSIAVSADGAYVAMAGGGTIGQINNLLKVVKRDGAGITSTYSAVTVENVVVGVVCNADSVSFSPDTKWLSLLVSCSDGRDYIYHYFFSEPTKLDYASKQSWAGNPTLGVHGSMIYERR